MLIFSNGLMSMVFFCLIILVGFVNTSYADLEIESLNVYTSLGSSDYFIMMVEVETSEPYHGIDYYLDDTFIERVYGNGERTYDFLWYDESDFGGSVKGTKHTLKLNVMQSQGNDVVVTETFKVYKPIVISGKKLSTWEKPTVTGVYGYNELSRHYFDGTDIIMDGYVYASNNTDNICQMTAWFRHSNFATGWSDEHSAPTEDIGPDPEDKGIKRTYGPYSTDSSILNYHVGGPIGDRDRHTLNVHIHLVADGNGTTDVWHGIDSRFDNEFTADDNP